MPLLLLFLIVPIIEIALFIEVGGLIGLGWTIAIVILTAILGTTMVRSQGMAVLNRIRGSIEDLRDPTEPLAHGAMILLSGALLLTPGFFTDAIGLLLLIPGIRGVLFRMIRERIVVRAAGVRNSGPTIIDAEYEDLDKAGEPQGPSGWTRH